MTTQEWVVIGEFASPHGVKGYIKVNSSTAPPEAIQDYLPWSIQERGEWRELDVDEVKCASGGLPLAHIRHFDDRDDVKVFTGKAIAVPRSRLPALTEGEYYWTDLVGLTVEDVAGRVLGKVDYLMETPTHDVIVVSGEKRSLIPFVRGEIVKTVSLKDKRIVVEWDIDF